MKTVINSIIFILFFHYTTTLSFTAIINMCTCDLIRLYFSIVIMLKLFLCFNLPDSYYFAKVFKLPSIPCIIKTFLDIFGE